MRVACTCRRRRAHEHLHFQNEVTCHTCDTHTCPHGHTCDDHDWFACAVLSIDHTSEFDCRFLLPTIFLALPNSLREETFGNIFVGTDVHERF